MEWREKEKRNNERGKMRERSAYHSEQNKRDSERAKRERDRQREDVVCDGFLKHTQTDGLPERRCERKG